MMTRERKQQLRAQAERNRVRREKEKRERNEGTPAQRLRAIARQMFMLDSPEEQDAFNAYADDLERIASVLDGQCLCGDPPVSGSDLCGDCAFQARVAGRKDGR